MISLEFTVRSQRLHLKLTLPDFCPFCQKHSAFTALQGYVVEGEEPYLDKFKVTMRCNNSVCREVMISVFDVDMNSNQYLDFKYIEGGKLPVRLFSENVSSISQDFIKIFNQSEIAEQQRLMEICGTGFRRSLEFLIKDYAIKITSGKEDEIKKMLLGNCIETFIDDKKIKAIAKRAAWIGNDETHYERRWLDKNLADLKRLIELTVHYIEMEQLYEKTIETMPDSKK